MFSLERVREGGSNMVARVTTVAETKAIDPETISITTTLPDPTLLANAQSKQIKTGLEKASEAQTQRSEADITEMMKAAGAQVGANKAEVCAALTPEFIVSNLEDAAVGR